MKTQHTKPKVTILFGIQSMVQQQDQKSIDAIRSAAITAMGFEDSDSMDSDSWTKLLTPRT